MAKRFLGAFLLCICSVAVVADEELPEIEFLEYLGSWDESDEDWLTVAEWPKRSVDSSDAGKQQDKRQDDEQES